MEREKRSRSRIGDKWVGVKRGKWSMGQKLGKRKKDKSR
jgi:hypothetical protein